MRQKAQNALGGLFHLPDFHDVILQCTGPLKIVEECVNNYIERTNSMMDKGVEEEAEEEENDTGKNSDTEGDGSTSLSHDSEGKENEESHNVDAAASMLSEKSTVILTLSILYSFLPYLLR